MFQSPCHPSLNNQTWFCLTRLWYLLQLFLRKSFYFELPLQLVTFLIIDPDHKIPAMDRSYEFVTHLFVGTDGCTSIAIISPETQHHYYLPLLVLQER